MRQPFKTEPDLNLLFDAGRKNQAETEREKSRKYMALRQAHSAVESDINALEHHGLDRCLDVGLEGFERYVGYGVLAFNLHRIGRELLERQRTRMPFQRAA
jgi:IS5 family transposase